MSETLHLAPGHVIISRDIVVDENTVGTLSYFERFGRVWIDVQVPPCPERRSYMAAAVQIALDRFTEMKIPVASASIDYDDDYLGGILVGLGFVVFQVRNGRSLLEKQLLP